MKTGRRLRQGDWLFSLALGLVALVPRIYVALVWAREPVWDGHYYDFGARRIAAGLGYSDDLLIHGVKVWHPWCHYPVGYSGLLALVYRLVGYGPHVAPVVGAVAGAATVVLTHRIAREWLGSWRGRLAAVLVAVHLELILYSGLVMTELVAGFGVMLAVWFALALRDVWVGRNRWSVGWGVSGIAAGLTTLVHPQTILLAPLIGATVGVEHRASWRRRMVAAVSVLAVSLAVVAPWTLRNCRVMDGCTFVSSNGGWNLAIGAVPKATGRFVTLHASDGCRVVTGQVQQDRCWAKLAWKHIRSDPLRWLALAPKKLGYSFDHSSFAVEYLRQADPGAWPEQRRVEWRLRMTRWHGLLWSLAAFAFVGVGARRLGDAWLEGLLRGMVAGLVVHAWTASSYEFWPLAVAVVVVGLWPRRSAPPHHPVDLFLIGYLLAFLVLHVVFFGEDRYHVPLAPWSAMLAAAVWRPSRAKTGLLTSHGT